VSSESRTTIERIAGVFDGAPIGVGLWSIDGELVHANPVLCDLLQADRAALSGRRFQDFVDSSDAESLRRFAADLSGGHSNYFECDFRCWRPDGTELWARAQVTPVFIPGSALLMVSQIFSFTDVFSTEDRGRQLGTHDYLTGLPNRLLLYDRLDRALARLRRYGEPVALLYLDLDRFKPVNDRLGHRVGDAVLCEVADRIVREIRESDTAARIGGDEFAVLLEAADEPLVRSVADRLIRVLGEPMNVRGHDVSVGVSIGVNVVADGRASGEHILAQADESMFLAKAAGRGRFAGLDPDVRTSGAVPAGARPRGPHQPGQTAAELFSAALETALREAFDGDLPPGANAEHIAELVIAALTGDDDEGGASVVAFHAPRPGAPAPPGPEASEAQEAW